MKTEKAFDCHAFMDRVQSEIYEQIKDLPPDEQIAFYRRQAEDGPLGRWWRTLKREQAERLGYLPKS